MNGLHLYITATGLPGLDKGTHVIVSQAVSALSGPVAGVVTGSAYGTYVRAGTVVVSGPTFSIGLPCLGTGGALRSSTGAGIDIGALETGTITNTARGTVTTASASAETTSTVQTVNVLDGLIEATAIKANAKVTRNGTVYTASGNGSSFGTLSVEGHPGITANVAANTRVTIAGVGTLYLNRVTRSEKSVAVIMIHLILTEPFNGLAPGTEIRVATASSRIS